jgi:hypothetical protein
MSTPRTHTANLHGAVAHVAIADDGKRVGLCRANEIGQL